MADEAAVGLTDRNPFLIDVDTGIDDAVALALAVGLGVDLIGVTTVAGNVPIETATRNTIDVLSYLRADGVPVHRGASRPLVASYRSATHVHGENGLGGAELPQGTIREDAIAGPAAIIRAANDHSGSLTVVTLGPLTNLAIALNVRPEITRQIAKVVVMGGAFFNPGNVTPHAEFNVYADPEASDQVFSAGFPDITLIGLDVTHQTALTRDVWERIGPDATGGAGLLRQILARTFTDRGMDGFFLHDPLALAVAISPELVGSSPHHVSVTLDSELRGKTVATSSETGPRVATSVDVERVLSLLMTTLGLSGSGNIADARRVD
ncbi:MAG: nucleoside hydrolase [Chloroflexia bacterium]|nr:nucleoside hydrolase [Chloroflexia bacterium]